ncbi:MAG: flagellar motor switch protein FliN [Actinomycetota bacterium]|nr:flagellar motor switch protein FliN [Actinomycetota bacterium]MDQ2958777.1 flagellar motor switch protein FliN [Actinomycetota bacterium]
MTETITPLDLARKAAAAALANLPISDPLQLGEPTNDLAKLALDGVAVTARFTGARSGEVLITVEQALADALRNSPLGALDVAAALAPALTAAVNTTGTALTGPGTALEPRAALEAFLGKPDAFVVPLLHNGETRALIGIVVAVEAAATPLHDTPHYPSPDELRASAARQPGIAPAAVRRGLDLLRDVSMDVTAQIGSTRMTISELLALHEGAVVELDRAAGAPADLLVNGHLIARGEVVVIDENFALRITEIVSDETVPLSS